MTDREKLIDNLRFLLECELAGDCSHLAIEWADYILANGVTFQKWIPVTERLPKDDRQVLACTKKGKAFSAHYDHKWKSWSVSHTVKITHWMPLPEPPKEE